MNHTRFSPRDIIFFLFSSDLCIYAFVNEIAQRSCNVVILCLCRIYFYFVDCCDADGEYNRQTT
jgi:hypothetical protein